MPFAYRVGVVSLGCEEFRDGGIVIEPHGRERVAGLHGDGVVVVSGEERGAGGGASSGIVSVGERDAVAAELIEMRSADFRAVKAEVRVAEVVDEDHEDVRPALCRKIENRKVKRQKNEERSHG